MMLIREYFRQVCFRFYSGLHKVNGSPWAATPMDATSLPAALLRIVRVSATTILWYHFSFQLVPRQARLFDRTYVLNGGDVARLKIERDCT